MRCLFGELAPENGISALFSFPTKGRYLGSFKKPFES
jgi:hypothetical protein